MPRPLLACIYSVTAICAVFLVVGVLLPDGWRVETARTMPVAREVVVARLLDFARWPEWNCFDSEMVLGPKTERSMTGAPPTPGAAIRWRGERGEAAVTLLGSDAASVDYDFRLDGRVLSTGGFRCEPHADGCQVTWHETGQFDNLVQRWFGWFGAVQEAVRNKQQRSLGNLRLQFP